jgi:hypothetical protein
VNWPLAAAAALLVVAVAAGVLLWRRRGGRIGAPEDAAAAAEAALPGFRVTDAVLGADGRAALVVGEGGRVALATGRGRAIVAHEIGWEAIRSGPEGLVVERAGRPVAVAGVNALDVRRMAPPGIAWRLG